MRTLFVERNSDIKDERIGIAKRRTHIEYLDELCRKVHEYIQDQETGERKHTDISPDKFSLKKVFAKVRRR